ncbi:MAG: cbb3-type cytochrome c oxidase subunit I, partial [Myxococcales bacterium]|nr:cbb3-type cytochrome c oxidase subunit I [Myxococcales bacterium]
MHATRSTVRSLPFHANGDEELPKVGKHPRHAAKQMDRRRTLFEHAHGDLHHAELRPFGANHELRCEEVLVDQARFGNGRERLAAVRAMWPVLLLFGVVMGGIYVGFFSPTEAAGVGAFGAIALALFVVQVALGALLAHYTVEGDSFYGLPIADFLPYAIVRTWHLQTAMFWIATAFLAAGLFLAPLIGGHEPKLQRLGVNVLFGALVLVVVGSLTGEWFSVHQMMGLDAGFWFGHQGY